MKRIAIVNGVEIALLIGMLIMSGCAPLLVAGGAVGGYAIAKNTESAPANAKAGK